MKKLRSVLLVIIFFQSQAFGQLGFVAFVPYQNVTLSGGGSANINVGGKLTNVGAVIANADVVYDEKTGRVSGLENDKGNMTVSAKEFEYEDLKDRNVSESKGWGVNTSLGGKLTDRGALNLAPSGSTTVSKTDKGKVTEQTTKATLGAGTITVNGVTLSNEGAEGSALAGLNRDITKAQEITKDEITGALDASVTIDNRVLLGFLKNEAKDKEGNVIYEKDENGEVIRDNDGNPVAKTTSGWQSIGNDFTNLPKNIEQVAKNLANNNIIVQSVKTALSSKNDYNLFEAANKYIDDVRKGKEVLDKYTNEINGATNLTPEQAREFLQEMASIYNENGEMFQGLEISNLEGTIAGLSYVDANGNKQTITINLANVDMTSAQSITKIIAHETTDITMHQQNEGNAKARASMSGAIMDMLNYGNINTNDITTEKWLSNYEGNSTLIQGNSTLINSIINSNAGIGRAEAEVVTGSVVAFVALAGGATIALMALGNAAKEGKLDLSAVENSIIEGATAVKDGILSAVDSAKKALFDGSKEYEEKAETMKEMAGAVSGDPNQLPDNEQKADKAQKEDKKQEDNKNNVKTAKNSEQSNTPKRLTDAEVEQIAKDSTHNPNSDKVMLGKYEGEGVKTSYQEVAKQEGATYFKMDTDVYNALYPGDGWRINQAFLRQNWNKEIITSHRPLNQTGGFRSELELMKNEKAIIEFKRTNSNLWKAFQ